MSDEHEDADDSEDYTGYCSVCRKGIPEDSLSFLCEDCGGVFCDECAAFEISDSLDPKAAILCSDCGP